MEQKNLFLAISLSVLVFITWSYLFPPVKQEHVEPTKKEVTQEKEKITEFKKTDVQITTATTSVETKETLIKTPLYDVVVSNNGAVFKSFKLNTYNETSDKDSDKKELINQSISNGCYSVSFLNKSIPGIDTAVFNVSETSDSFSLVNSPKELTYTWISENGVVVEKTFRFNPDTYLINCIITIKNGSDITVNDNLSMSISNKLSDTSRISFEGPSILLDGVYEEIDLDSIEDKDSYKGEIGWAAIHDRYFMISIIPENKENLEVKFAYDESGEIIGTNVVQETGTIIPGSQKVYSFNLMSGPKRLSTLKQIGHNIDKVVNFGWFDFIAKPCLMLMDYIYANVVSNYGIAIIVLTIIFKIIVWPLGNKSYKSMNEMKKLQPLVAELREKYKDDRQKMNEEMMGLYKTYKVNPLSGCLPMVVQMPIFFAFYRMLYSAIELRHAPFFGWITDLSAPDRLFNFDFTIPYYESPTGIPVLTLLMGASMFLQQKMSPPAGDPTQARMMMMMPVFMTFIFMNFSSGLVLYWLVNNLISIAQQYYIMKKNA